MQIVWTFDIDKIVENFGKWWKRVLAGSWYHDSNWQYSKFWSIVKTKKFVYVYCRLQGNCPRRRMSKSQVKWLIVKNSLSRHNSRNIVDHAYSKQDSRPSIWTSRLIQKRVMLFSQTRVGNQASKYASHLTQKRVK